MNYGDILIQFFNEHWVLSYVLFLSFYFWVCIALEVSGFKWKLPIGYHILVFFTFLILYTGECGFTGFVFLVSLLVKVLYVLTRDYTRYVFTTYNQNPFEK